MCAKHRSFPETAPELALKWRLAIFMICNGDLKKRCCSFENAFDKMRCVTFVLIWQRAMISITCSSPVTRRMPIAIRLSLVNFTRKALFAGIYFPKTGMVVSYLFKKCFCRFIYRIFGWLKNLIGFHGFNHWISPSCCDIAQLWLWEYGLYLRNLTNLEDPVVENGCGNRS